MTQRRCPSCGSPVSARAVVCKKCGTNIDKALAEATASTSMMSPHDSPTVQYKPPPTNPDAGAVARGAGGGSMLTQSRMMQALRDATLGDYEILAELGRGGMATVYLAHDISLDRKVAIKVMSPALLDGEGAIERFKREAKTAAALSHPHIIPIYTVKQVGDLLFFVMKYVEGQPLDVVLRARGALPIQIVVQLLTQVAGALAYAHRRGVIHRDIKPANIMVDDEGWAVVTDFGIAKVSELHGLTLTGSTVGTPAYMSPEQCAAKPVTGQSDQYSLGIVGYELLSAKVPFTADSLMGMLIAQTNASPPPLLDVRKDCPRVLAQTIERMMAKSPEERWPSMDDVATALAPLQKTSDSVRTRVSMAALARVGAGRPRADDFVRPESPTPLNTPRSAGVTDLVEPPRRSLGWVWGAVALPLIGLLTWLATRDQAATPHPVPADSTPAITSPVDSPPGAPTTQPVNRD
jgi:serine/threonine protein kinase